VRRGLRANLKRFPREEHKLAAASPSNLTGASSSGARGGVKRASPEFSMMIAMMALQFELEVNQLDALSQASA
jgi:hypothetical protein